MSISTGVSRSSSPTLGADRKVGPMKQTDMKEVLKHSTGVKDYISQETGEKLIEALNKTICSKETFGWEITDVVERVVWDELCEERGARPAKIAIEHFVRNLITRIDHAGKKPISKSK